MEPASRTPEGPSGKCPVCRNEVHSEPSFPMGDALCPNCGTLLWFDETVSDEVIQQLAERGAFATMDDEGQIISIRLCGPLYNDFSVGRLGKIVGVQSIDIRDTRISPTGAARLRDAMPGTVILYGTDESVSDRVEE